MVTNKTSVIRRLCVSAIILFALLFGVGGYLLLVVGRADDGLNVYHALIAIAMASALACALAVMTIRRWLAPVQRLEETLQKISEGDFDMRAAVKTGDEFEVISDGIDHLLAQRYNTLRIENENERLNDSIISLLKTVANLADKDLSARAKVRADVTGPIADALNLMATETARVLHGVTEIATNVAETSNFIKTQSDHIVVLARKERENLEACAQELSIASDAQSHIASLAQSCSELGEKALGATRNVRVSIQGNVSGYQAVRDTLREIEGRMKVLLERCQELTRAITLSNHTSDRTHILALNANMHAAAVGEAGRGFGTVAEEVQRLAENTREVTAQIGASVQNVQSDTNEIIKSLQMLSAHVRSGSDLAERSGREIVLTEDASANLVDLVKKIAAAATSQQQVSNTVRQRTAKIIEDVGRIGAYLLGQAEHTDNLVEQAMRLVESIGAFRLPDDIDQSPM